MCCRAQFSVISVIHVFSNAGLPHNVNGNPTTAVPGRVYCLGALWFVWGVLPCDVCMCVSLSHDLQVYASLKRLGYIVYRVQLRLVTDVRVLEQMV